MSAPHHNRDRARPCPCRLIAAIGRVRGGGSPSGPFGNLILSHADRTRVLSEEARKRVFSTRNGQIPGTVLVDGFVAGTWKPEQGRRIATLRVELFRPPGARDRTEVETEGDRLLRFAAPGAASRDMQVGVEN